MEASISLKSIGKKISNNTILAELSFGLQKGTRLAVVGPNNSGKSSIMKLLSGIIYKDKGQLYLNGIDMNINPEDIKRIIGYMSQKRDFNLTLNLFDNICLYGELYGFSNKEIYEKANILCDNFSINSYKYKKIHDIPESIVRIAMFIRAVLHDPEIIILDEPTISLDVKNRKNLWSYLFDFYSNKTLIFSTQNLAEARKYSNRIAIVHNSVVKFIGSYSDLMDKQNSDFSFEQYLINMEQDYKF